MENTAPFATVLPEVGKNGYFEMRLESIGGLGANLCGKLLGELGALYLGLSATAFSSYGSEKRGSPVRAFVRYAPAGVEIRHSSPVTEPQLLVLFHTALWHTEQVTAGVNEACTVVVNTDRSPQDMRRLLQLVGGRVITVDAARLAREHKSRLNMVMLGAVCRASGFLPLEAAQALVTDTMGKKYPALLQSNLAGLRAGYETVSEALFENDGQYEAIPYTVPSPRWGYDNAPIGGVNPLFGSTVSTDVSAAREGFLPLFLPEKCIHCGLCDSTCPDMVFQFTEGTRRGKVTMMNRGLDYHHCKGCLRCVDVCPTEALVAGEERSHPMPQYFVRNKDLIVDEIDFEVAGADPVVTGEGYLTEKRQEGGAL